LLIAFAFASSPPAKALAVKHVVAIAATNNFLPIEDAVFCKSDLIVGAIVLIFVVDLNCYCLVTQKYVDP
jgi:hypothetical protein